MRNKHLLWVVLSILFVLLLFWKLGSTLVITSNDTGRVLWSHSVSEGEQFIIRYTHSVARTEVDEVIRVGDEELIIDSTIYESFGAGLPSTIGQGQTIRREGGKVIIGSINQPVPRIDLYVGQVIANHTLLFQGDILPLSTLSKPGTSIQFSISSENLFKRLMGRLVH